MPIVSPENVDYASERKTPLRDMRKVQNEVVAES